MADLDEYELLDKQLEEKDRPAAAVKDAEEEGDRKERKEKRSRDEKDRKRRHRSRSRSKDRERDRDRKRSSKSRDRDRDRDRDRKDRHRSGDRERDSGRERSRRNPSPLPPPYRGRPPPRAATPPEVIEMREREKELKELDRDTRTVFAYNLNLKADERDLFDFFSGAGEVVDVRIIMDRNTRRSKGFAYIEMASRDAIIPALSLAGQTLMGQSVMVKSSEAEKNLAWEAAQAQTQQMAQYKALAGLVPGSGPAQLTVRNLHPALGEEDLRVVFAPFGHIIGISIANGTGTVQFGSSSDAEKAIQNLDGLEIAGSRIMVEMGPPIPGALDPAMAANMLSAGFGSDQPTSLEEQGDGGGMRMTADARAALMQRLSGQALPGPPAVGQALPGPPPGMVPAMQQAAPAVAANPLSFIQGLLGPASPIATPCLVLKGMFDPAEETEPDWEMEIAGDTKEECAKFGPVLHLHVDRDSKGFVYVKFATQEAASAAQRALDGRWFAGRQICAEYQFAQLYAQHFGV